MKRPVGSAWISPVTSGVPRRWSIPAESRSSVGRYRRRRHRDLSLRPMKIDKRPVMPQRIRRVPREGWSWIDRRFLRHHASALSGQAITLYFFLAAVSDKHGVSFYSDATTADLLRLDVRAVQGARDELVAHDLVVHHHPVTQVLSLPERRRQADGAEPTSFGDILRQLIPATTPPGERS